LDFRYGAPDLSDKVVNLKTGAARVATPKRREVLSFIHYAKAAGTSLAARLSDACHGGDD
jgi:hypothetical protein